MRNKYKGDDVRSRLHGTIIRFKNHPYLVDVEPGTSSLGLHDLESGDLVVRVEPDDPNIDISSLPLGYVNLEKLKIAVYIKREPLRRFKQGVVIQDLTQRSLSDEGSIGLRHVHGKGLVDCVINRYPTMDKALLNITRDGWKSVAIDRDIAFKRTGSTLSVFLKDEEVGIMKLGSNRVTIKKTDVSWVHKELLEKVKTWEVVEEI
jgi:hypothetical protein